MKMDMACCGWVCDGCDDYQKNCKGCNSAYGAAPWCKDAGMESCPIYNCCVLEHDFPDCSVCEKLPCELFLNLKDPSVSDEEHRKTLESRLILLKAIRHY